MRRFFWCIVLLVQISTWVPATSRLLDGHHHQTGKLYSSKIIHKGNKPAYIFKEKGSVVTPKHSLAPYSIKQEQHDKMVMTLEAGNNNGGVNKLGSRPPNCEHKCDGCMPCVAIQVPTITSQLGVQYANYEPESWKCKCGPTFYSP